MKLPMQDGRPFIESLEASLSAGDLDHVRSNSDDLQVLIEKLAVRQIELATLEDRARAILEAIE